MAPALPDLALEVCGLTLERSCALLRPAPPAAARPAPRAQRPAKRRAQRHGGRATRRAQRCARSRSTLVGLRRERRKLYVAVDLLGLGVGGAGHALQTAAVEPSHLHAPLSLRARVPVEPGEPIWQPMLDALASDDEQHGEVRFVLFSIPFDSEEGIGGPIQKELGSAQLNLKALLKARHEPEQEQLPMVDAAEQRLGWLTVSMKILDALQWASSNAGSETKFSVSVGELTIEPAMAERVSRKIAGGMLAVRVELPSPLPTLCTPQLKLEGGATRGAFAYSHTMVLTAGSAAHLALLAAVEVVDRSRADVRFTLFCVSEATGGRQRDLGSVRLNLHEMLEAGADVHDVEYPIEDERRAGTIARIRLSLQALQAVELARHGAQATSCQFVPPRAALLLKLARKLRQAELGEPFEALPEDEADEEAGGGRGSTRRSGGIDFALLDSLPMTSLEDIGSRTILEAETASAKSDGTEAKKAAAEEGALAVEGTAASVKEAERLGDEFELLRSIVAGAQRLGACRTRRASDFHAEQWPRERVERLWRASSITALYGLHQQRQAWVLQAAAQMRLREQELAAEQLASRNRQRMAALVATIEGKPASSAASDLGKDVRTLAQEVFALREVVSSYERLTVAMHGALQQLATEHLALSARCERSSVLLEGWDPRVAARWIHHVQKYSSAVAACARLERTKREVVRQQHGKPARHPLDFDAARELCAAVEGALGSHAVGSGARERNGETSPTALVGSTLVTGDAGARGQRERLVALALSGRRLRLRGEWVQRLRGETIHLTLTLRPAELGLPILRSLTIECTAAEVEPGLEGVVNIEQGGAAWKKIAELVINGTSTRSVAQLQLRAELHSAGASRVARRVGVAILPLWPLLSQEAAGAAGYEQLGGVRTILRHEPALLLAEDGSIVADVQLSANAPQLVLDMRAERRSIPAIALTIRSLTLDPELLKGRAAWGVWVEADLRLSDEPLRTNAHAHDGEGHVRFDSQLSLPIPNNSAAQMRLLDALSEPPGGELRVQLRIYSSGELGSSLLARGELRVAAPRFAEGGTDSVEGEPSLHHVELLQEQPKSRGQMHNEGVRRKRGKENAWPGEGAGQLVVSVEAHRVMAQASARLWVEPLVRVAADWLELSPALQRDVGLSCVWLEVRLPPEILDDTIVTTRLFATRGALRLELNERLHMSPSQITALGELLSSTWRLVSRREAQLAEQSRGGKQRPREQEGAESDEVLRHHSAAPFARVARVRPPLRIRSRDGMNIEGVSALGKMASEAEVRFVLKGEHWRGEVELGQAAIDLLEMARSREEKLAVGLLLLNEHGHHTATLRASVCAQQALRAAWWRAMRKEHLSVMVHSLRLDEWAVQRVSRGGPISVWVETDLAGVATSPCRTPELHMMSTELAFHHPMEAWVAPFSTPARVLEEALRSSRTAPITFKVGGRTSEDKAMGRFLGEAKLPLRHLLAEGGDIFRSLLPVLDVKGVPCGELCISMLAQACDGFLTFQTQSMRLLRTCMRTLIKSQDFLHASSKLLAAPQEPTLALFGPRTWEREEITISIHSIQLEPRQHALPERALSSLWVELDFLGLDNNAMGWTSERVRRQLNTSRVSISAEWTVQLDFEGPAWKALQAALESDDEQDSDVFFVVFGAGSRSRAKPLELGMAHVNMEEILRSGRDPTTVVRPVLSERGERVASVTVSVKALEALQWVWRCVADKASLRVSTAALALDQAWLEEGVIAPGKHKLELLVEFPNGMPCLRSGAADIDTSGRCPLMIDEEVIVSPGSEAQLALVRALEDEDVSCADVFFSLVVVPSNGEGEKELGVSSLNLHELLRRSDDLAHAFLTLRDERHGKGVANVGTLEVSFKALKALRQAEKTRDARRLHANRYSNSAVPIIPIGEGILQDADEHALMAKSGPNGVESVPANISPPVTGFPILELAPRRELIPATLLQPLTGEDPKELQNTGVTLTRPRKHVLAHGISSVVGDIESD